MSKLRTTSRSEVHQLEKNKKKLSPLILCSNIHKNASNKLFILSSFKKYRFYYVQTTYNRLFYSEQQKVG